ncbi:MAG: lipid IV(A) 3-deoxy-D-manno-octulosonic acid transferase [Thiobacillaceae bacterium]
MQNLRRLLDWTLYRTALLAALPLIPLRLLWRGIRERGYWRHWSERFSCCREKQPDSLPMGALWVHAVSVGETRAAAPLIAALRVRHPDLPVLLTCMTVTGRATAKALYGDFARVCYLPYDYTRLMRRFITRVQPRVGVLMETELWPNLIREAARAKLPLVLANARLSERSARGYARLPALMRDSLGAFRAIAAQTEADAARLKQLGARNVTVTGSLKFDITASAAQMETGQAWRKAWGASRLVLLAASTRAGEEDMILSAFVASAPSDVLLVLVPRHPQRFDEVAAKLQASGLKWMRRSKMPPSEPLGADVRVVLGDSLGELFAYYAACDVTFVGGSLLPFGGQNLIEACSVGCPVLIGPHTFNFETIARTAIEMGAAQRIENAEELVAAALRLLVDTPARKVIGQAGLAFAARHRGVAARVADLIEPLLDNRRFPPDPLR